MENGSELERPEIEERLRTFIALRLDDAVRSTLRDVAQALQTRLAESKLRWVPPENLHLTLCFLGDVESARIEELAEKVRQRVASLAPFTCELEDLMLFPSPRRPRVIAVGLGAEHELAQLADAVAQGVRDTGFATEERSFRPHITLARLARPAQRRGALPADALQGIELPHIEQWVRAVELFRSRLLPTGAVYSSLSRCPLAKKGSSVEQTEEKGER